MTMETGALSGRRDIETPSKSGNLERGQADQKSVEEFSREINKEEKRGGQPSFGESPEQADLSSMFNQMMQGLTKESQGVGKTVATEPVVTDIKNIEELVDQILVNTDKNEMTLRINNDYLRDTSITLARGSDGVLTIKIETGDQATLGNIIAARGDLEEKLNASEKGTFKVDIVTKEEEAQQAQNSAGGEQNHQGEEKESEGLGYFNQEGA